MKDNFSSQSDRYAKYRPHYPEEFYAYLNSLLPIKENAWDCGTGNGQVAFELAKSFKSVFATDISQSQLNNAQKAENISYSVQAAEKTDFQKELFDLVVVAQAIHWFDFEKFYAEVNRTARKNALICVLGYGRISISETVDSVITNFYKNVVGPYWDVERRYIDQHYETIPFPFHELSTPRFAIELQWNRSHLLGYLNTWSAVKHFTRKNGYNPVEELQEEIASLWKDTEKMQVQFPILLRIGRVHH